MGGGFFFHSEPRLRGGGICAAGAAAGRVRTRFPSVTFDRALPGLLPFDWET